MGNLKFRIIIWGIFQLKNLLEDYIITICIHFFINQCTNFPLAQTGSKVGKSFCIKC